MNILNLSMANIRKGKGAAFSLMILIVAASMLLNSGITIKSAMGTFYEEKAAELHEAHVNIAMAEANYKPAFAEFIQSYAGVKAAEAEKVILLPRAAFRYDKNVKNDFSLHVSLLNADTVRKIAPLKLVGQSADDPKGIIYVPYSLKASGGYELGDSFSLNYRNIKYNYRIGGFFESTLMGAPSMAMLKFYLPDAGYRQLSRELGPEAEGVLLSAVFNDSTESASLLRDYSQKFAEPSESTDISFWSGDIGLAESSTLTVNIVAMILVVFAAIIVLVSLIVIKFRIAGSIEQGMINIGVLKAVGYTSGQILASIVLQFMITGIIGTAIGLVLSYAALPAFGGIITSLTGLLWTGGSSLLISFTSAAIVLVLILAAALTSSRRVRRLQPVAALRGGITTHSFKRNPFPLHKARGRLQFLLACKSILASSRQNLMIGCIITAITFASVFSVVLYYNIAEDKTSFFQMLGTETPNVGIEVQPGQNSSQLLMQVVQMPGVEKANIFDELTLTINGKLVSTDVSNDYGSLDNYMVYKGRYAAYDNEIVITEALSRLLGKGIGDTLQVKLGDTSAEFLITGLNQSFKEGSGGASITLEGAKRLVPGFSATSLNVYLKDGTDITGFMRGVQAKHGDLIQSVTNVDKSIEDQTRVYTAAVFSVMVVILAITVLVVSLILYLVIQSIMLKQKRELGIMRALGYTTFQLRTQIALSFVPVVAAGVGTGAVLGGVYTSPMLAKLLSGVGVTQVEFNVPVPLVLGLGIALILFAYLVSMAVSHRIKRITAYGLITE